MLYSVVALLRQFEGLFEDVVVRCARKTDSALWCQPPPCPANALV